VATMHLQKSNLSPLRSVETRF